MSGIVALWIVILVIRAMSSSTGEKPAKSRNSGASSPVVALVIWVSGLLTFLSNLDAGLETNAILWPLLVLLFFPSQLARLSIAAGMVRTSYLLGRLALMVNHRSTLAGGLFYGWLALQKLRDKPKQYRRFREFLEYRLGKASQLNSGLMIMRILMRAEEVGEERTYIRLRLLKNLDAEAAPRALVRHAFLQFAAHALARGDWDELRRSGEQWRQHCYIPLAGLLVNHHRLQRGERRDDIGLRWFYWLGAGRPKWLHLLPPVPATASGSPGGAPDWERLLQQSWRLRQQGSVLPDALRADWQALLQTPAQVVPWQQRAIMLGCRNPDAAVDAVKASVRAALAPADGDAADSGELTPQLDLMFSKLRFLTHAIERRRVSGNLMNGHLELEELLNFLEVFQSFASSHTVRYQAYAIVEHVVWNWMADLWNIKNEKSLAFLICGHMVVPAAEFGSDAARVYQQILRGEIG